MYQLQRTDSANPDFQQLVMQLDKDLAIRDGAEHAFFAQFNKITHIQHVVLVYEGALAVGCGAIKAYAPNVLEVKRMYVPPTHRGLGIASLVLGELERWAKELGAEKCVLETGIRQPEAIRLYQKNNYQSIPNYGQYEGVASSVCFEKML